MKKILLFLFLPLSVVYSQNEDSLFIRKIFNEALSNGQSYEMLQQLCNKYPSRLCGSPGAEGAVKWSQSKMSELGFNAVRLQVAKVPHWVRGPKEEVSVSYMIGGTEKTIKMHACALGGSAGTPPEGISGEVVEVKNFEELKALGKGKVAGKIVYFSRPMDPRFIQTFRAYGGAVNQRTQGAAKAAPLGAIGVIIRSMTLATDTFPHTGAMRYKDGVKQIPEAAISTVDADLLSEIMKKTKVKAFINMGCHYLPDVLSHNVICDMQGSKNPGQVILSGGHLDAWDLGSGAHDDGSGCVQSLEALRLLKTLGYTPNNTLRCVFFMNEEFGLNGGFAYADSLKKSKEKHLMAIESDRGAFLPLGFTFTANEQQLKKIKAWSKLLKPYGLYVLEKGHGGSDIGPISKVDSTAVMAGLLVNSQAYFDYHHAASNVMEAINKRELELGAASIAALMYLVDKYGLN